MSRRVRRARTDSTGSVSLGLRRVTALMAAAAVVAAGSAQAGAPPPSTERKAAAVQKAARDMKEAAALRAAATAAGKKKKLTWLRGKYSHTYEQLPNGNVYVSTIEFVGYRGAKDASRPRVGDVYLGTICAGRAGDGSAGDDLATEVMLPRHTRFAINKSPRGRVRCYFGKSNGSYKQLKGKKCPNRPKKGKYGWRFGPRKGSWSVPTGRWIQITFPLRSKKRLKGLAGSPNHCIMGAVWNLSGFAINDWDAPRNGESCPTADGHGPYQGVFVAPKKKK